MKRIAMLLPVLGSVLAGQLHASIITVGRGGGYDYPTITAALTNATAGDTIQVALDTYSTGTGESFPLRLQQPVTLESLTAGTSPHLLGDNLHTVVSIETGGVTVRGLQITDGLGSEGINLMDGGGICVFVGPNETNTVHIEDCLIENNWCTYDETYDGCGGGIYCGGTYCECFQIHISGCTIRNNNVPGNGAGVCCALLSIVRIENTLIEDNTAEDNGGGVYVDVYGFAALSDNTRLLRNYSVGDTTRANFGGKGGGLFCESYGFFVMTNCVVAGNWVKYYGGGIFTRAGDWVGDDPCLPGTRTPEVAATLLATNWAEVAGGGTYLGSSGKLVYNQSTNYWNDALQDGGALYVADGVSASGSVRFTNDCLLEGNQCAGRGGGVYLGAKALGEFAGSRFLGNSALLDGGGVFQQGKSSSVFTNCLLTYNNSARGYGGGLYLSPLATNSLSRCTLVGNFAPFSRSGLYLSTNVSLAVSNSILWRNAGGSIETNGANVHLAFSLNDSADPLFVGWGTKSNLFVDGAVAGAGSGTAADPYCDLQIGLDGFDFRLATNSPCLGTASDGGNQGATTGTGGAAGGTVATLNLVNGVYDIRGRNIIFTRGLQGNGSTNSFIGNGVFGYVEDTFLRDLAITGERWFGGIVLRNSALMERSRVFSNEALHDGGGIYISAGTCVLRNSDVDVNIAQGRGGGVWVGDGLGFASDQSGLLDNQSVHHGGGLFVAPDATAWITNASLVRLNRNNYNGLDPAAEGGGVYALDAEHLLVQDSGVEQNASSSNGGGVRVGCPTDMVHSWFSTNASLEANGGGIYSSGALVVTNCLIEANTANYYPHDGGGLFVSAGSAQLYDSEFLRNEAADFGGGLVVGASPTLFRAERCGFLDNSSKNGGAGWLRNLNASALEVVDCWFRTNQANRAGALDVDNTRARIIRCEFTANTSTGVGGGAVRAHWGTPLFSGCTFTRNSAKNPGGAAYLDGSTSLFRGCSFDRNSAGTDGGLAAASNGDTSLFSSCVSTGCSAASRGGGLFAADTTRLLVEGCSFLDNQAGGSGGAMAYTEQSAPRVGDTVISNCSAVLGGGFYADGTTVSTLEHCQFLSNVATNNAGSPDGGGANFTGSAAGRLACCWFDGNRALDDGGALSVSGSGANVALTNCFLVNNQAVNSGGGAHFTLNGAGTFQNCTLVSNRVQVSNGGGVYRETTCPVALDSSIVYWNQPDGIAQSGGSLGVNYSCIQEPWLGTGNLTSDPLLNPLNSSLLDGSPCIDAGNPSPAFNDSCLPPGKPTARNDMGASGGPGNCCQAAPSPGGPVGCTISVAREAANLELLWPDALLPWDPIWRLYETTNLPPPFWTLVTNSVTRTNGQVLLMLPMQGPGRFFRLQSP